MPELSPDTFADNSFAIRVFGAKSHNLQNINVEIPLGSLTVITGVSGSGKSSLAFDTIFAEGRHRYLTSISAGSRNLLQGVDRPDVDDIDALPPVLCVEQRLHGPRKRSTVATASDIYDYLRLLYARVGRLHCPTCRVPVAAQSRAAIVEQALRFQDRQKVVILAPVIRSRAGTHQDVFARIVKDGYVRARVDGEIVDASTPPELASSTPHDIDIVVDRLIIKEGIQSRLEESVDLALQLGQGQCVISHDVEGIWQDRLYSSRLACATCGTSFPTIEPRLFSFNSTAGACATCLGTGAVIDAADNEQTCLECHGSRLGPIPQAVLIKGIRISEICAMSPSEAARTVDGWSRRFAMDANQTHFESSFRLPKSAQSSSAQDAQTSIDDDGFDRAIAPEIIAARHILPEIANRLQFLQDIGLDYLTLDRGCETLSAGELQRTRLAACLGTQLTGVCYILDEPTAGLHARDTQRLLQTLVQLRDDGNTVLLIEHDISVIRAADHVIDLGPGAGVLGGQVLASGTPNELARNPASITGRFLGDDQFRAIKDEPEGELSGTTNVDRALPVLRLAGATLNNLKGVTIELPLQRIVCVTGVSGSGKTSLIVHTLVPAIRRALGERIPIGGPFQELTGFEALSRLVRIDQSPLGRSARSNLATYSGIWDDVRHVFAKTKESRLRGYTSRQFSLSVSEARCPNCAGRGELPVDERRFSDWTIRCPECDGHRFAPSTLSVRYRGQTVADILEMSVADAAKFFENFSRLAATLTMFNDLGLGYLKLGQSATTLSGGEAQRIKLGTELAKSVGMQVATLYVLDEPTSGLHPADVQQLVNVLRRLVENGNSILVVEHNVQLINAADWIIEVGPGAGTDGGEILYCGSSKRVE